MVLWKILWLWVLFDSDDSYTLFGFVIGTILLSLMIWLTTIANIQIIVLLDFV